MQPKLYIRLLGDFRVAVGEKPVTFLNTPRLQALLAYLLLRRDAPQTRQHIAFLFWPDSSEVQAQSNLRHLIHALRRTLPEVDADIEIENRTIRWKPTAALTLDIADFESAVTEATLQQEVGMLTRRASSRPSGGLPIYTQETFCPAATMSGYWRLASAYEKCFR